MVYINIRKLAGPLMSEYISGAVPWRYVVLHYPQSWQIYSRRKGLHDAKSAKHILSVLFTYFLLVLKSAKSNVALHSTSLGWATTVQ